MFSRRLIIIALLLFGLSTAGCGSAQERAMLKQARDALKQGNTKVAIQNTKTVLRKSPNNIFARRLMSKIKSTLREESRQSLEEKNYKEAVEKVEALLDLDPQDEGAKAMLAESKKHLELANARDALAKDNPMAAVRSIKEALRLDPQFKEAKELQVEANKKVEEKIANLVITAQQLIQQGDFEKLRDLAQDILAIDPENREAADFLREAQSQILIRNRETNLSMARKFFSEGIYESALSKAEEVLRVDPNSEEAKELVQKSKDELAKPELRLTGLSKIKGMVIAHIEVPATGEKFRVRQGDTFLGDGDFKVSLIDLDLKAIVVTYTKTGSQQTISITTPELSSPVAPSASAASR